METLDLAALPSLDDLSGDLIETLEDHADQLLGLGINPNTTAEMIGALADDLLDRCDDRLAHDVVIALAEVLYVDQQW